MRGAWILALLPLGCTSDGTSNPAEIRSSQNRSRVAASYRADPLAYWSHFALPAAARLGELDAELGRDPAGPFAALMPAFREATLLQAAETSELPPLAIEPLRAELGAGRSAWMSTIAAITTITSVLDDARFEGLAEDERAALAALTAVTSAAFDLEALDVFAPTPIKDVTEGRPRGAGQICGPGDDRFSTLPFPGERPDDRRTSPRVRWSDIEKVDELWKTTFNAACGAVATGACAAHLGLLPDDVSPEEWNELSEELGAQPNGSGTTTEDVYAWFAARDHCCIDARDGLVESACEEAALAARRQCDVFVAYFAEGQGHFEMVLDVTVDPAEDARCTLHTLSWSVTSTVTIHDGTFSEKLDGARYRKAGEMMSYLEGTGRAELAYCCPCPEGQ